MPKISFDTAEAIPAGLKEFATEENGKFVVDAVPAVKLTEFRDNNIAISRERDRLNGIVSRLAPVVGEDVDAFLANYLEISGIATQVKDGKLKGSDAIEAEILNRVASMKTGFERQLSDAAVAKTNAERLAQTYDQRYRRTVVDQAVTQAVIADVSGALPSALPDILGRAYQVFQVSDDGKLVAKDGDAIIYGSDGTSPMTPIEWVTGKLRETAPYFFKNSNGGGATGGGTAGDARFGGMNEADFRKLSPEKKLALANSLKK